jgi:hypothetical protein
LRRERLSVLIYGFFDFVDFVDLDKDLGGGPGLHSTP